MNMETLVARPQLQPRGRAPSAPKMSVEKLDFYYGKFHALKNVNLDIAERRVTAFIGPSGCGKSTLLRTLNRMYSLYPGQRAEGRITLNGANILEARTDLNLLRAKVGMVFQKPTPFPTMSVFDNVSAGLRVNGRPGKAEMMAIVEAALRRAALWDEVKDRLHESALALSGGQQQRLCIARSIAPEPEVILLDEPTSALDPQATQRIEELVFELKQDYTIVIVTHNMQQAARVSDTTTFFYLGQVIEHGATKQLFTTPRHEQTEAYITGRFG